MCKAGDLLQDKQQGRQSRCGDCGGSAKDQMKGCNRLTEQGRKERWGGRPKVQAKDVNTARMGRNWWGGRGGGVVRMEGCISVPLQARKVVQVCKNSTERQKGSHPTTVG